MATGLGLFPSEPPGAYGARSAFLLDLARRLTPEIRVHFCSLYHPNNAFGIYGDIGLQCGD